MCRWYITDIIFMKKIGVLLFLAMFCGICCAQNVPAGYVDLGLPSGTLWKKTSETNYHDYNSAIKKYGGSLPTKKQWEELKSVCDWTWSGKGYQIVGPNGQSIFLPAAGVGNEGVGKDGKYWSSTSLDDYTAWSIDFDKNGAVIKESVRGKKASVRLVISQ